IVHKESVQKVADGRKPADQSDRQQAQIVLKRIEKLQENGVTIRFIDDLNTYSAPGDSLSDEKPLILGGAFFGECIAGYQETLGKQHIPNTVDPLLTVRAR